MHKLVPSTDMGITYKNWAARKPSHGVTRIDGAANLYRTSTVIWYRLDSKAERLRATSHDPVALDKAA